MYMCTTINKCCVCAQKEKENVHTNTVTCTQSMHLSMLNTGLATWQSPAANEIINDANRYLCAMDIGRPI